MDYPDCTCSDPSNGHSERCPTLVFPFRKDGRPKIAPVQGYVQGIPWALHLRAYNAYEARYRGQAALIDIEKRGCRGGFGTSELDMFVPGWRDELSAIKTLTAERDAALARVAVLEEGLATAMSGLGLPIPVGKCVTEAAVFYLSGLVAENLQFRSEIADAARKALEASHD